jgi:hypothetical protein
MPAKNRLGDSSSGYRQPRLKRSLRLVVKRGCGPRRNDTSGKHLAAVAQLVPRRCGQRKPLNCSASSGSKIERAQLDAQPACRRPEEPLQATIAKSANRARPVCRSVTCARRWLKPACVKASHRAAS